MKRSVLPEPTVRDIPEASGDVLRPTMTDRRTFLRAALGGTVIAALGGAYYLVDDDATRRARGATLADGRPRLPPNQHVISRIKPMGGQEGDPNPNAFRLNVYGEVEAPFVLDFAALLAMPQVTQTCDVHCVTKWSLLDSHWTGVKIADLAARAKLKSAARYVIFESAHGYSANVPIHEALKPNALLAHRYEGQALPLTHGAPVRAVVPDLYFWKSAKWLTAIHFVGSDQPGYWETRGYSNHADPWKEERYS